MTDTMRPPGEAEFELTLLGPGYGESIVLHVGEGRWVIVDSCFAPGDKKPGALRYLESIGVEAASRLDLIVATHWHDDHIRGMAQLVEGSPNADFCCAGAFCAREFLALMNVLDRRRFSSAGSGLSELQSVFLQLTKAGRRPIHAIANRTVFRKNRCVITSLSPDDGVFQKFLSSMGNLIPSHSENKRRILQGPSPNKVSVALRVVCGGCSILLGADLERPGWVAMLKDAARPTGKASVFKIPHHGSEKADEPTVWERMLEREPTAVLAPWRRGRGALPSKRDVERILAATPKAWITSKRLAARRKAGHQGSAVKRSLRDSGARFRKTTSGLGVVRLRRPIEGEHAWAVEPFGDACHLKDYEV